MQVVAPSPPAAFSAGSPSHQTVPASMSMSQYQSPRSPSKWGTWPTAATLALYALVLMLAGSAQAQETTITGGLTPNTPGAGSRVQLGDHLRQRLAHRHGHAGRAR